MKRLIAVVAMVLAVATSAAAYDHFFPARPAGVVTTDVTGVLVDFAHGMGVGSVVILDDSGKTWTFYLGYPATIDGTVVTCMNAPTATKPGLRCSNWPTGVIAGSTRVTATYWPTQLNGVTVFACDALRTAASGPLVHKRKAH